MRTPQSLRTLLIAVLLLPPVTAACGSKPDALVIDGPILTDIPLPAELTFAPGGSAEFASAGLRLKFDTVTDDSRCPSTVTCVWAGAAVLRFTASRIAGIESSRILTLSTEPGKDTATVFGQPLRLVRVDPVRTGAASIPLSTYRAVVKIGAQ